MATSIDSYRGRNWTDRLSTFASLYSVTHTRNLNSPVTTSFSPCLQTVCAHMECVCGSPALVDNNISDKHTHSMWAHTVSRHSDDETLLENFEMLVCVNRVRYPQVKSGYVFLLPLILYSMTKRKFSSTQAEMGCQTSSDGGYLAF